jgi:eukaryotic-like serine/threonine-protein kinase
MSKFRSMSNRLLLLCLLCTFLLLGACGNSSASPRQTEDRTLRPILKWKAELGESIGGNLALADGVIYAVAGGYVYALNAATGETKWKTSPPRSISSSPAVANGFVYFGTASGNGWYTRTSTVIAYALDTRTGSLRWQRELSNDRNEYPSNPVVANGRVYFGIGWSDYSCCENRGNGGRIIALDAESGGLVWQMETKGDFGSGGIPTSTFSVVNGMVYLGVGYEGPNMGEKTLTALDAKTGKEAWKVPSEANFPLVAPDGMLYPVVERELLSIDGKMGQERWRWILDSSKESLSKPTVVDDIVYIVGNEKRDTCFEGPCPPPENHTDTLYALNTTTGKEKWKRDIAGGYYSTRDVTQFRQYLCYPMADFVEDFDVWYLEAVDRQDGTFKWQFKLEDDFYGSQPVVVDDTMYFGTSKGSIYALQLP